MKRKVLCEKVKNEEMKGKRKLRKEERKILKVRKERGKEKS
jgi:hypothetical protein